MTLSIRYTKAFDRYFEKALKKHPKSKNGITRFIDNELTVVPINGDRYPGFGEGLDVRKVRIALVEYRINRRNGLRLLYLYLVEKQTIVPLFIYIKSNFRSEHKIQADTKKALKEILVELKGE